MGGIPVKKVVGLILIIVGIGVAIWAYQMSGSVGSQFSQAFSGSPSDGVMIRYIGGMASVVVGSFLLFFKGR